MKKTIGFIIFIALVSIFACNKDTDDVTNNTFTQAGAEEWFNTTFKNSKEWQQNPDSQNKIPDWSNGMYQKKDSLEIFEFPLMENKATITVPQDKSITDSDTKKILDATLLRMAIIKTSTNEIIVRKLYYVPEYKYLLSKGYDISDVMLNKTNDDFTGLLITKHWNDALLSYHKVKNGKIEEILVKYDANKAKNNSLNSIRMNNYATAKTSGLDDEQNLDEVVINNNYHAPVTYVYLPSQPYYPTTSPSYNPYGTGGGGGTTNGASSFETTYQIINLLNGRVKCVYQRLMNSDSKFKNAIQKFDGQFPVSHLKLSINNNLESNVYGITLLPVGYVTEIQFNENSFNGLSDLGRATVFAHEIIHAEIFRKMLSAAQLGTLLPDSSNMTIKQQTDYVKSLKNNFPGLYEYYFTRYKPTWNHEMMANHYRTTIADVIQEFDNNRLPRSTYEAVAWLGLGKLETNTSTIAWEKLSVEQKAVINALIKENFYNGPSTCN
jgi:hypothetical protein